ncbi:MAG TPA: HisA/HisF-related TIM barrel protein, partial [Archangium sp.]
MIAIPAIDLREGACVQLVGGSYADERVRVKDPLDALKRWRSY